MSKIYTTARLTTQETLMLPSERDRRNYGGGQNTEYYREFAENYGLVFSLLDSFPRKNVNDPNPSYGYESYDIAVERGFYMASTVACSALAGGATGGVLNGVKIQKTLGGADDVEGIRVNDVISVRSAGNSMLFANFRIEAITDLQTVNLRLLTDKPGFNIAINDTGFISFTAYGENTNSGAPLIKTMQRRYTSCPIMKEAFAYSNDLILMAGSVDFIDEVMRGNYNAQKRFMQSLGNMVYRSTRYSAGSNPQDIFGPPRNDENIIRTSPGLEQAAIWSNNNGINKGLSYFTMPAGSPTFEGFIDIVNKASKNRGGTLNLYCGYEALNIIQKLLRKDDTQSVEVSRLESKYGVKYLSVQTGMATINLIRDNCIGGDPVKDRQAFFIQPGTLGLAVFDEIKIENNIQENDLDGEKHQWKCKIGLKIEKDGVALLQFT